MNFLVIDLQQNFEPFFEPKILIFIHKGVHSPDVNPHITFTSYLHFVFIFNKFAATNRRGGRQTQEFKTARRRNSTLTATRTFRRGSHYQEIQVATLPDLSENLINESQTWEEIREIKAMPVHMAQKRELKNQLQVSMKINFLCALHNLLVRRCSRNKFLSLARPP